MIIKKTLTDGTIASILKMIIKTLNQVQMIVKMKWIERFIFSYTKHQDSSNDIDFSWFWYKLRSKSAVA